MTIYTVEANAECEGNRLAADGFVEGSPWGKGKKTICRTLGGGLRLDRIEVPGVEGPSWHKWGSLCSLNPK